MSGRAASDSVIPGKCALSVGNPRTGLATGWAWISLLDAAEMGTGHTPSRGVAAYWNGPVQWMGIRDARAHHGGEIWKTVQTITQAGLDNSSARLLPAGTVVLSRTASVGYVVQLGQQMATSQDFVTWTCGPALEPRYLMRALQAEGDDIRAFGEGSTHTTIYFPELKAFHVKMPPVAEQRRIVAKIDRLSARSKRARDELEAMLKLAFRFKHVVLRLAFTGQLTSSWRKTLALASIRPRDLSHTRARCRDASAFEAPYSLPKTWSWFRLPELGILDRGKSRHRPRNDPSLFGGDYPFIQTGDVRIAERFISGCETTYNQAGLAQSRLWPTGTVCITIAANIAETAILAIEACFPDSVVGFVGDNERVLPAYVEFFIRTARADLNKFAPATAQKNINLEILGAVRMPTAPIEEQTEIVRRIEHAFAAIDRLAAEAQSARALLDTLDQAILAKAFRGELVPQDPNDEPASVLLARIRAERAAAPAKGARGRPRGKAAAPG